MKVLVKKWHEVIGEKTLANAIPDRIVHQSIRIKLYVESLRKKQRTIVETVQPIYKTNGQKLVAFFVPQDNSSLSFFRSANAGFFTPF